MERCAGGGQGSGFGVQEKRAEVGGQENRNSRKTFLTELTGVTGAIQGACIHGFLFRSHSGGRFGRFSLANPVNLAQPDAYCSQHGDDVTDKIWRIGVSCVGSGVRQSVVNSCRFSRLPLYTSGVGINPFVFGAYDCNEMFCSPESCIPNYCNGNLNERIPRQVR